MNVAAHVTQDLRFRRYGCCVHRSVRAALAMLAALALGAGLTACISGRSTSLADTHYDLGMSTTQAGASIIMSTMTSTGLAPLKVAETTAPPSFDSDNIVYRIGEYQVGYYANSHWTMPPARLFTQVLRDRLAQNGAEFVGWQSVKAMDSANPADVAEVPVLKTELGEFSQRFDSPTASKGIVSVRAALLVHNRVYAQHTFSVTEPASSPDAAGGARALASASKKMTDQIARWVSGVLSYGGGTTSDGP